MFRTKDKALSEAHSILSHYGFPHNYTKGSELPLNCYDTHTFQDVIFSALSSDTRSTCEFYQCLSTLIKRKFLPPEFMRL